ncbi:hypothetical protein V8E51_001226 [Hyaloscypha variabilis]
MSSGDGNSRALPRLAGVRDNFKCQTCQRGFKKAEHLTRHERSHSKTKPYPCPDCPKEFGRQDVLARHRKLHEKATAARAREAASLTSSMDANQTPREMENIGFSPVEFDGRPVTSETGYVNDQPQLFPTGEVNLPLWTDGDNMLELLTSDLSNTWPLSLPISQFEPIVFDSVNGALTSPLEENNQHSDGQGHQAMQQMSRLISVLSSNLTAEIQNTAITSSFLDTCLHVFFDKFTPSFPVLHRATFVVKESSHPLLLNIVALGSLFVGARDAVAKGESLWRLAHIAVATNWKHLMATKGPRDPCQGVQLLLTAVLGQTYALMSKNESLRMTSQIFHGLGFYWARQCGMFSLNQVQCTVPPLSASDDEKMERWKVWAAQEVQNRAVLGHYVLDGHISQFSGYAACARHVTNPLRMPSSDAAFDANTADGWIEEMLKADNPKRSFREAFLYLFSSEHTEAHLSFSNFTLRVLLEGLQSLAADFQEAGSQPAVGTPAKEEIVHALMRLYKNYLQGDESSTVEKMELLIRWHSIFLDLAAPSTALCRKLCVAYNIPQKLHDASTEDLTGFDPAAWSQSQDALKAVVHAFAIQAIVEKMPLGRSHAIHLPSAVFAVSTIYSARCIGGSPSISIPVSISWETVWYGNMAETGQLDTPRTVDSDTKAFLNGEYSRATPNSITKNLMYELNSLQITLNTISSRWGVSHDMDGVLQQWISIANGRQPSPV